MKSFSFAKFLTLGCFVLALPVACGDDDDGDGNPGPSGGSGNMAGESGVGGGEAGGPAGGAPPVVTIPGTSTTSETIECGGDDCSSTGTILPTLFINPCCTAGAATCGVDSGFLTLLGTDLKGACLPKDQPGELDSACPDSPGSSVPFNGQMIPVSGFKGCCRPNNTCGFLVDVIETGLGEFTSPELGCVDSAALGGPSVKCGEGAGGAGGAGGASAGASGAGTSEGGAGGAGGAP